MVFTALYRCDASVTRAGFNSILVSSSRKASATVANAISLSSPSCGVGILPVNLPHYLLGPTDCIRNRRNGRRDTLPAVVLRQLPSSEDRRQPPTGSICSEGMEGEAFPSNSAILSS